MIGSANSNISLIIFLDKLSYPALFVFVVRNISITSALVTGSKKNEVGVLYLIYDSGSVSPIGISSSRSRGILAK